MQPLSVVLGKHGHSIFHVHELPLQCLFAQMRMQTILEQIPCK